MTVQSAFIGKTKALTSLFQITFTGRVSTRNFEGSITVDVSLPTSSEVSPINYFVGSGGQLPRIFDL